MPKNQNKLNTDITTVEEILFKSSLIIPTYQRPYKWNAKNVNQLIDDVLLHSDKTAYRLGTVVLHNIDGNLNIVDGQQRLFTLSLIAFELLKTDVGKRLAHLQETDLSLAKYQVTNPISAQNIKQNHLIIKNRIKEFSRDSILFFFQKCEFVYIELTDISEAFQFFDSQNTRGKDLAPHDLLKAFHLRKMIYNTEKERIQCVIKWEEVSDELHHVFENYLFKIRQWSKGHSGLYFSKNKVDTFKGITLENPENFNFIKSYTINHFFTNDYNYDNMRNIDNNQLSYPFQIDQVIINGKRFFEYVHHYAKHIEQIENAYSDDEVERKNSIIVHLDNEFNIAKNILSTLRRYKGKNRSGDLYVKNIFDCCLLYFNDKFGTHKLDEALLKFFLWSYALRLEKQAVQLVTVDNLAKEYSSFFRIIREGIHTNDIIHREVKPALYVGDKKAVKDIEEIVKVFEQLNAIETND